MAEHRRHSHSYAARRVSQPGLVRRAERLLASGTAERLRDQPCRAAFAALTGPAGS